MYKDKYNKETEKLFPGQTNLLGSITLPMPIEWLEFEYFDRIHSFRQASIGISRGSNYGLSMVMMDWNHYHWAPCFPLCVGF